jgi:hypothetical protein
MTWGFPAQRRADEFDALVEGLSTEPAGRDADLLTLVGALRAVPEATPRPAFVADLRERLMTEAATALVPADPAALDRLRLPARQPRRERRLAAVVGGLAIVGASTGMAVASQSALPGDSLYPIKRAIESAHADLSVGEGSKGSTILASAADRLHEVDALTRQDRLGDDVRIADTLATFTDQATEASDLLIADYEHTGDTGSIAELHDFASSSLDLLATLEPLVPAEARDELLRAATTLATIDAEAGQRCPSCGGTPITSIPGVLVPASEVVDLPLLPSGASAHPATHRHATRHHGGQQGGGTADPQLPQVQPGDLGPGSILGPGSTPSSSGGTGSDSDPLGPLTGVLTGGGDASTPTAQPSLPSVGEVVQGVGDGVGQVLDGVVNPLTGQSASPTK